MTKKELQVRYFKLLLMCRIAVDIIESQREEIEKLKKRKKRGVNNGSYYC